MRNSIPLLFALMAIVILGGNYWYQQLNCCSATAAVTTAPVAPPPVTTTDFLRLRDGSNFDYTFLKGLPFAASSAQHLEPLATDWSGFWQRGADYLGANAERALLITGYYHDNEINNSIYPNLGIARANDIRAKLIAAGAPAAQIETTGELIADTAPDTLASGITFGFKAAERNDDRVTAIRERIQANPITLYFATGENNLNLSAEQRQDFADLNYYLGQVADAQVAISGHTDNQGNRQFNINLSKERADFARDYLVRNGIGAARIDTDGEGPDRPVATNATDEGRALNRRVEITLK